MRNIIGTYRAPKGHWVGDGFPVSQMFSYSNHGKHLNPFYCSTARDRRIFRLHKVQTAALASIRTEGLKPSLLSMTAAWHITIPPERWRDRSR